MWSLVPVDHDGVVDLQRLSDAVNDETLLVTVMAANNETGVLAPLPEIAQIAHARGALLHTDATQLLAWGGIDVDSSGRGPAVALKPQDARSTGCRRLVCPPRVRLAAGAGPAWRWSRAGHAQRNT